MAVFYVVDIDKNDNTAKLVSESGPSDDYKNTFYAYAGKGIVKLGTAGLSRGRLFRLAGIVTAHTRGQTMGHRYNPRSGERVCEYFEGLCYAD